MDQQHYVGLDVSLETTSICVIDNSGAVVWRGKCATEPDAICRIVRAQALALARVGLETGQLSNWLTLGLRRRGLPVVCLDARHAKAALSLQVNKTDANDALGLAQVVRTGWFREVAIKSMDAQTLRMLLMARAQLVSQRQAVANNIRGLLKTFGHVIARGGKGPFPIRVRDAIGVKLSARFARRRAATERPARLHSSNTWRCQLVKKRRIEQESRKFSARPDDRSGLPRSEIAL
jgi:transposase